MRALVVLALAATALAADFYSALGVSRTAGDRELKKACTSTLCPLGLARRLEGELTLAHVQIGCARGGSLELSEGEPDR